MTTVSCHQQKAQAALLSDGKSVRQITVASNSLMIFSLGERAGVAFCSDLAILKYTVQIYCECLEMVGYLVCTPSSPLVI